MSFDVSTAGAYVVLYAVLAFFTVLAMGAHGWLYDIVPEALTYWCDLDPEGVAPGASSGTDYFLSARASAGTWSLALSFFASGMGAWVLYGTTEMGATPQLSWLGVLGYSFASAFPAIWIGVWMGPRVRRMTANKNAFSTTDFGRQRYGRVMQVTIAGVSLFYMFIFIVAELTSISNIFALLTGEFSKRYGIIITVSLGLVTILYTTIGGLPASIVTDKFQGVIMGLLVVILTLALTTQQENDVTREQYARASNFTGQGAKAAVTLILAIWSAEMFNQSTWQRVWAAKDETAMRNGFMIGAVMVFFLMMFFGVMGMIAYSLDPEAYDNFERLAFLSFFDLLEPLGTGWQVLVLILVTALAASSVDSLQNGMTSVLAHDLVRIGWNPTLVTRILIVLVNIPAIYLASEKFNVISLFLVADLVCATSVLPVFLGLQTEDYKFLTAPTELGAFLGCVSGFITVLVNGAINDVEGGLLSYFWLRNGGICALCGTETMVSFIVTPAISGVATYVFSYLDVALRGDAARQPLIALAFDAEDDAENDDDADVEKLGDDDDDDKLEKPAEAPVVA